MEKDIIIAGGGIGGLSAAVGLAQIGRSVQVFEKDRDKQEVGAGIQIGPNGVKAIAALGLLDKVKACSYEPNELVIYDGMKDRELVSLPLKGFMDRRFAASYYCIARYDLYKILLEASAEHKNIKINSGENVIGFEHGEDYKSVQVRTCFETKGGKDKLRDYNASMLIGADGVWSQARRGLVNDGKAFFTGHVAWRKTVDIDELPEGIRKDSVCLWLGAKSHLVYYPIEAGKKVNIVAITEGKWRSEKWNETGAYDELKSCFVDWAEVGNSIVALMDKPLKWALCGRIPSALSSVGCVTLLGDAYHPMLPYLAQGAVMALEDALILRKTLEQHENNICLAVKNYEDLRNKRVMAVQQGALDNAKTYHYEGVKAKMRNAALRLFRCSPSSFFYRYKWLYGYDAT